MRPYYDDTYTSEFNASVTECFSKGESFAVILDNSYFYPTSGGQEHDTGFIGEAEVTDVIEEDDRVVHIISRQVQPGQVSCRIDWKRRIANMQQHTGQHMLSAAFDNLFGIGTVSSRLGEYVGSIDLSRQPTDAELSQAVEMVNMVIREDRPVTVHYAEPGEIGKFSLRKRPKVVGTVRIIDVRDFDMSACGGTHCTHTSEIGVVLTGNLEKVKGALTRIEFFCGERAVRRYYELFSSARESSRLISSGIDDLPSAVRKLKAQIQERESRVKELSGKILESICDRLTPKVDGAGDSLVVIDLSSEIESTEDLRFVGSCVSKRTKKSFAFHHTEGNICYMNLNLTVEVGLAASIIDSLRSDIGVKGGGRGGYFSITFEISAFENVVDFVRRRVRNG